MKGVEFDSRKVKPGDIFVAIRGGKFDGHDFIEEAVKNGAVKIYGERNLHCPNYFKVKDSREKLGELASKFYGEPSKKLKLIGVTGTKGKTTTCHLIAHILTKLGQKTKLISTITVSGFHTTTPDAVFLHKLLKEAVDEGCRYAVIEVSSHGIDQKRIAGASFDVTVLTNIAPEHLDYHKTFEMYKKIKTSFLNSGKIKVVSPKDTDINILPGKFNNLNAETAVKVVEKLGFDRKKAEKALQSFELPEGRLEEIKNDLGYKIYVDFAHTPDSLQAVLTYLRGITRGKLIVVFGSAGERDPYKRPKMGKVASKLSEIIILTAEDPRTEDVNDIIKQIKSGIPKNYKAVYSIPDRKKAIKFAIKIAKKGDTIAILGKGHEKSMNMNGGKELPWSDQTAVAEVLNNTESSERLDCNNYAAVVLGAGQGTRMKSDLPKVLHELGGKPLIKYILDTLSDVGIKNVVVVVGYKSGEVIKALGSEYTYATQEEQKGNAHAVLQAKALLENGPKNVLIFQGDDSFLFTPALIRTIQMEHEKKSATITFLTCDDSPDFPESFWFVESKRGNVISSVHEGRGQDTHPKMLISTYLFDAKWLWDHVGQLRQTSLTQKEIQLPGLVQLAISEKKTVVGINIKYGIDWFGVNTPAELLRAKKIINKKK